MHSWKLGVMWALIKEEKFDQTQNERGQLKDNNAFYYHVLRNDEVIWRASRSVFMRDVTACSRRPSPRVLSVLFPHN